MKTELLSAEKLETGKKLPGVTKLVSLLLLAYAFVPTVSAAGAGASGSSGAAFKTPQAKKAFEAGKKAFMAKEYKKAGKLLTQAGRAAKDTATKRVVAKWINGLTGLKQIILIERNLEGHPAWGYITAQKKRVAYYQTAARPLYNDLLRKLEAPRRNLVKIFQDFEIPAYYSAKFGKTFIHKAREPEHVIMGKRSLKWECKNRDCVALKFPKGKIPKNWSRFEYLAFWMYGTPGKVSKLQIFLINKLKKGKKRRAKRRRLDGFQAQLPSHKGWKFVTLRLRRVKGEKPDFRRVGTGDLSNVGSLQFQLPSARQFVAYIDHFVLIDKDQEKPKQNQ